MIYLNNENFDEEVIQSKGKILVEWLPKVKMVY